MSFRPGGGFEERRTDTGVTGRLAQRDALHARDLVELRHLAERSLTSEGGLNELDLWLGQFADPG